MGILISAGTIVFGVLAVLLIIVILLQADRSGGMGIIGGSSQSTFGSSSVDVITKITAVMVALFMAGSLGLSIMESKRTASLDKDVIKSDVKPSGSIEKSNVKPEEKNSKDSKK
jgi:preprotein translocase subunit SecG